MRGKLIVGVAVVIAGVAAGGMILRPLVVPAAEHGSAQERAKAEKGEEGKQAIAVDRAGLVKAWDIVTGKQVALKP